MNFFYFLTYYLIGLGAMMVITWLTTRFSWSALVLRIGPDGNFKMDAQFYFFKIAELMFTLFILLSGLAFCTRSALQLGSGSFWIYVQWLLVLVGFWAVVTQLRKN